MDNFDGFNLVIGGSAIGAIATVVGSLIKAKFSKTKIDPQPLQVDESDLSKIVKENSAKHENFDYRIRKLERELAAIDERTKSTNDRLDRIDNKLDLIIERFAND